MKKILSLIAVVGISGVVHATTINAPSALVGTGALNGNNAYSWGISIAVPTGQVVTSAQIDFTSVTLTAANGSGTGYLYTDLLNSQTTGVTMPTDNDAAGDYWLTKYSGANLAQIGTQFFKSVGTTLTWSYVLNASQLVALNSYLASGTFNIGLDPDCHYNVGGISFTYTTGKSNLQVPDMAETALLLIAGLAALEVFRRQLVSGKAKA
jgi:hypothetical protein